MSAFPWRRNDLGGLRVPGRDRHPEFTSSLSLPHMLSVKHQTDLVEESLQPQDGAVRVGVNGALFGFAGGGGNSNLSSTFSGPGALLRASRATISPSPCSPAKRCLRFCDSVLQMKKLRFKKAVRLVQGLTAGNDGNGTQTLSAPVPVLLSSPLSPHRRCCPRVLSLH